MLRRINDALPGLVLGIIVYGVIVELAGVWFVTDKVRYTCLLYTSAKAIIQSGIRRIVYDSDKYETTPAVVASKKMLNAAGVVLQRYEHTNRRIELEL